MSKINRFYLLVAALIYAKSYTVANAAYLNSMTDDECGILQKLLTQLGTYSSESQADTDMASWCMQQDGGTDGEHYQYYEDHKATLLTCAFRSSPRVLNLVECSVQEGEYGCGVHECTSGHGWNEEYETCQKCVSGQYLVTDFWNNKSWYGPRCRPCPDHSVATPSSDISTASTANDCYIAGIDTWAFTGEHGTGVTGFDDGADCYYDGDAYDVGTGS